MYFIKGLPSFNRKEVILVVVDKLSFILVVVDKLSKYGHFLILKYPYISQFVARCFWDNAFKLHSTPTTVTNDRDPIFLNTFWQELFRYKGFSYKEVLLITLKQMVK